VHLLSLGMCWFVVLLRTKWIYGQRDGGSSGLNKPAHNTPMDLAKRLHVTSTVRVEDVPAAPPTFGAIV
jgi:hypothetical protein